MEESDHDGPSSANHSQPVSFGVGLRYEHHDLRLQRPQWVFADVLAKSRDAISNQDVYQIKIVHDGEVRHVAVDSLREIPRGRKIPSTHLDHEENCKKCEQGLKGKNARWFYSSIHYSGECVEYYKARAQRSKRQRRAENASDGEDALVPADIDEEDVLLDRDPEAHPFRTYDARIHQYWEDGAVEEAEIGSDDDEDAGGFEPFWDSGFQFPEPEELEEPEQGPAGGDDHRHIPPPEVYFDRLLDNEYPDLYANDDGQAGEDTPGKVAYYRKRLNDPIHHATDTKLKDHLNYLAIQYIGETRDHFEKWLKILQMGFPTPNIVPTSAYVVMRLVGVRDLADHIYHFCPCGRYRYAKEPIAKCTQAFCPKCGETRFQKDVNGRLSPRSWCFYLGLDVAIKEFLFANPNYTSARVAARGFDLGEHTFWGCKETKRYRQYFVKHFNKDYLADANNDAYELFGDFFQSFKGKNHSTGAILLRSLGLDTEKRAQLEFTVPLMIIPGPKAPKHATPYMELIARDFMNLLKDGVEISGAVKWADVDLGKEPVLVRVPRFRHRPILVGFDGDIPMQQWVANSIKSCQAFLACFKCLMNGVKNYRKYETRATVYPGFNEPLESTVGPGLGKSYQLGVDAERGLTHKQQKARAEAAEKDGKKDRHKRWGVFGPCVFMKYLPYLDYNNFFRTPLHHIFLLGLVKDFWKEVLRWDTKGAWRPDEQCFDEICLSKEDIKLLRKMFDEGEFRVTWDFNRAAPKLRYLGQWMCEDWLRFTLVFSPFIRREIMGVELPPLAAEMWQNLRKAVIYYIYCLSEEDYSEEKQEEAYAALLKYGQLIEANVPRKLTSQLHRAACWLPRQLVRLGATGLYGELYGERSLKFLKNATGGTSVRDPEKIQANAMLFRAALYTFAAIHRAILPSELNGRDDEEVPPLLMDDGDEVPGLGVDGSVLGGEMALLGNGHSPTPLEREEALDLLIHLLDERRKTRSPGEVEDDDLWCDLVTEDNLRELSHEGMLEIAIHSYACIHRTRCIASTRFKRSISRVNKYVQVRYNEEPWVAEPPWKKDSPTPKPRGIVPTGQSPWHLLTGS
ncbi:hypothetical protein NADE_001865 [Nannochloris sp. 'desiccata']|nr:hypothetical protein KSW81_002832 [Chlorella desiccata (nom. nud.)]KAH7624642.1 hypothetical protein NADE_001865 [Chlorella desiccata (nom. nud.)]